jgi:DNA-binding MarR family transcriptional regulator
LTVSRRKLARNSVLSAILRLLAKGTGPTSGDVTLRQLRYFAVLGEELNYRRAAERLFITQPALSTAIKQLEPGGGRAGAARPRRVELWRGPGDRAARDVLLINNAYQ